MSANFLTPFQCLTFQHLLSRFAGCLAESRITWFKNFLIRKFVRDYHVDMTDAVIENPLAYANFNDFFIRRLKPHNRPIVASPNSLASPVDGIISQIGHIDNNVMVQAKGFYFDLVGLLAGDSQLATTFENGSFATLYLAPRDYHRIHMPIDGKLIKTIYVPGHLFSVNNHSAETTPNLYSRNERLICLFDTAAGQVAIILVGAMIVGSIQPVWLDHPARSHQIEVYTPTTPTQLKKGDELGYFKLGSTVIVLFEKNRMQWDSGLTTQSTVRMGQLFGAYQ